MNMANKHDKAKELITARFLFILFFLKKTFSVNNFQV